MLKGKMVYMVLCAVLIVACPSACLAQAETGVNGELKDNWNDFLHYTKIGRFDLAKSYAQTILDNNPDPVALLNLTLENPLGYEIMLRVHESKPDAELVALTEQILAVIEQGRFIRRSDPQIVVQEVKRLSSDTERGRMTALKRLREAGEFAIPFMLDVLADPDRRDEVSNVIAALPQIGQPAIRPLAAAIQSQNSAIKLEVIRAMGDIGYPQALPYLKYVVENDASGEVKTLATQAIQKIDPTAFSISAAEQFFKLGEMYYDHAESLQATSASGKSQIWFWDTDTRRVVWQSVDSRYFHELMAMRCCEWSLKTDPNFELAVGLWLAGFFKAEAVGVPMPAFFGEGHADAFVYATTAGPKYLQQALARGLDEGNAAVALGAAEALIVTAGKKSIFVPVGSVQPLLQALTFSDKAVRYSAAIAIATASPRGEFQESDLVIRNLAQAIAEAANDASLPGGETVKTRYDYRAISALISLGASQNDAFDLSLAQDALIKAADSNDPVLKVAVSKALSYINSPMAQGKIAAQALNENNSLDVRIEAFSALANSGRLNDGMLEDSVLNSIYELIRSDQADKDLRARAATAYGSLNLPSDQVKNLVLDQAQS